MKNTMKTTIKNFGKAFKISLFMMIICGLLFPLLVTGTSFLVFPKQARGNIIEYNGKAIGSKYIGQDFTKNYYLWGRPSAYNYNTYKEDENGNKTYLNGEEFTGVKTGSYNYAASNPKLKNRVEKDVEKILKTNPGVSKKDIPLDLITASGSGLDPHISLESANIQVDRIAKNSGLSKDKIKEIIKNNTENKLLGVFGEKTVNVLLVNIEIDREMKQI